MRICRLAHRTWYPRVQVSATLSIGRDSLRLPSMLREPTHIFTMPAPHDLFAQSDACIAKVFDVMHENRRHEFQVATSNMQRAADIADRLSWGPNIWLGAVLDDESVGEAVALLLRTPARVRFAHVRSSGVPRFDVNGLAFVVVESASEPGGFGRLEEDCALAGTRLFLGAGLATAELRPATASTALTVAATTGARR